MDNSRRMIYPYTVGAKLAQFPFRHYWEKSPFFRMYIYSILVGIPVFHQFTKLSHSPSNYEKFKELEKRNQEEHQRHLDHLL